MYLLTFGILERKRIDEMIFAFIAFIIFSVFEDRLDWTLRTEAILPQRFLLHDSPITPIALLICVATFKQLLCF